MKLPRWYLSLTLALLATLGSIAFAQDMKVMPAGTRIYFSLEQLVSSERGESDVGMTVACKVWRDVEFEGTVFIKAGTPATCRVDKVKRNNIGGVGGKLSIGGVETKSTDGQPVLVQGGYNKEGGEKKTLIALGTLLVFWPLVFWTGDSAELAPGTIFDVSSVNDLAVSTPQNNRPKLRLSAFSSTFSAEVLLENFASQKNPEYLPINVTLEKDAIDTSAVKIDSVNGSPVPPIDVKISGAKTEDGRTMALGEVKLKSLAKFFKKGINRFDVSYRDGGERIATEVVLDIEI